MIGTLVFIGIVAVSIVTPIIARPHIKRSTEARHLRLAKEREAEEARKQLERELVSERRALVNRQPDYFRDYGIKVVEKMMTPRVAETGTLHLAHPVEWTSDSDDGLRSGTYHCKYRCGEVIAMREIGAVKGPGVEWLYLGWYCPSCGALGHAVYQQTPSLHGPLGRRLKGATNLFDVLGPPKSAAAEDEWTRLEVEQTSLEARLSDVRSRRLALAEKLGKPIDGGPFRPRLVANND